MRVWGPTGLAQHVGKADVGADGRVHLHPGRHGVQLAVVVQLVQEFLHTNTTSSIRLTVDRWWGLGLLSHSERCGVLGLKCLMKNESISLLD